MNGHLQFDEDYELYALGALDPDDKAAVESHLHDCAECREKLAAAHQRIALLGLSVPPQQPPARVKDALMKRVRQQSPVAVSAPPAKQSRFAALWYRPMTAWACAAVIAAIALTLATRNFQLQHRLTALQDEMRLQQAAVARDRTMAGVLTSPDTQRVVLRQSTEAPRPEGKVYYHSKLGLLFYAANLQAAPGDHVYQLWLVPSEGAPISAGVFQPNSRGDAAVVLPKLPSGITAKAFAVTVEPSGGVPQPTGPKILIGMVS